MSSEPIKHLSKVAYLANQRKIVTDLVLVEQPLQINLLWQENQKLQSVVFSITMRTPGQDKQLITGLLLSEGIIRRLSDIEYLISENTDEILTGIDSDNPSDFEADNSASIEHNNQWQIKLIDGLIPDLINLKQYQIKYSSCGLCGNTSLKSLDFKQPPQLNTDANWLAIDRIKQLPKMMKVIQPLFIATGGAHAAALFDKDCILVDVQEDIGRHNALDKMIGAHLQRNQQITKALRYCAVISSRISFEMVQKTIMAGIPVLIAVGAVSDLAISAAQRYDLTLIGFTSDKSFNVYHGDWRIASN